MEIPEWVPDWTTQTWIWVVVLLLAFVFILIIVYRTKNWTVEWVLSSLIVSLITFVIFLSVKDASQYITTVVSIFTYPGAIVLVRYIIKGLLKLYAVTITKGGTKR